MLRTRVLSAALLCVALLGARGAHGQPGPVVPAAGDVLRVFLDCHGPCDFDHLRREITYVNWVRDRQDADVHLLLTAQDTGGGGQQITLEFLGLRGFAGSTDQFSFTSRQSDTFDEVRALVAQRIGLGLARYAARGGLAGRLRLTFQAPEAGATASAQQPADPWNLWVFTLGASGHLASESQYRSANLSGSFRARRVTEAWKFSARVQGERSTSRYTLEDSSVVHSRRSDYTLALLGVRSLGEHWSFGLNAGARRSSRENYDVLTRVSPGLEYDVFPYRESSRRQFVFVYEVALLHARYHEETIYSKRRETRLSQALTAAMEAVQPWGTVELQARASNYLDRWSQNRLELEGGMNLRIARGLELNLNASYARVHDQISLSKSGASDDEVLLQLKQLRTSYTAFIAVGLNYTFGSKYNNVVNPRYDSSLFDF